MTAIPSISAAGQPAPASAKHGLAALGQGDFLRMLTAQLRQQDPFEPMDQQDMLAQMAQFSSLAGITETNAALQGISDKLDQLIAAQQTANSGTGAA